MRGRVLGRAYVRGFGMVVVFADMDNSDMFFVRRIRGKDEGATRYVARSAVGWRK